MRPRLLGLETEYAIRYTPKDGERRPGNDTIYGCIADGVRRLYATSPGERGVDEWREQLFVENGGALCYEFDPEALHGGLVEASTPECRSASQLLLYQKAEEALLLDALPHAQRALRARGFEGEIGLLKNCRDGEGHIYGAQENYEVEIARGLPLFLHRAGLFLLPLVIVPNLILWWVPHALFHAVLLACVMGIALLGAIKPSIKARSRIWTWVMSEDEIVSPSLLKLEPILSFPMVGLFMLLVRAFAFKRFRRHLVAFIASRPIISGTGTVSPDLSFGLSEKAPAMRRLIRTVSINANRPIFETGNLIKQLKDTLDGHVGPFLRLFARRQRLQLGLADSNVAQVAEYLKIGTTSLVIDMIESRFIEDAPRLVDPIGALHAIAADPTLKAKVSVRKREPMSALEIQRWYLDKARAFVASSGVASIETHELVRLWGEALDALESDPQSLVGRLDWVTKRFLLESASAGEASYEVLKKIDLRYHELGQGYLAQLERDGIAMVLVDPGEVRSAIKTPPQRSPARMRSRLIRELAGVQDRVTVSWDSIRIGGRLRGRVIRLVDAE
jgi:proteasome accessory factor A